MTRVVVTTLGSLGDLHPFLAIARALTEAGVSTVLASAEPHRQEVEAEGVEFQPILSADEHERAITHPQLWHPVRGFGVLWRHMAVRAIDPSWRLIQQEHERHGPGLRVFTSPLVVGARLARAVLPFHLTTAHLSPSGLRSSQDPFFVFGRRIPSWTPMAWRRQLWAWVDKKKLEPMARPGLVTWLQRHGQEAPDGPIFERWLQSPDLVVGLFPPDFGDMPTDWPVRVVPVGFPLFESGRSHGMNVAAERLPFRPTHVVCTGSAPTAAAAGLRDLALRLADAGHATLLIDGATPAAVLPNLCIRKRVNLHETLPGVRGLIHHGGIGMCAQGLAHGVPQRVWPSAYDQFDNASRVASIQGQRYGQVALNNAREALAHLEPRPARLAHPGRLSLPGQPNEAVKQVMALVLQAHGQAS